MTEKDLFNVPTAQRLYPENLLWRNTCEPTQEKDLSSVPNAQNLLGRNQLFTYTCKLTPRRIRENSSAPIVQRLLIGIVI